MKDRIRKYFEEHRQELLDCIASLVEIPSIKGEAERGKPFGAKPYEALCKALEIADGFGFKTETFEYVGTVETGEGEPELGILAHLDVVPAGDGWHTDPFKMTIQGDKILGRGVSDDKGPAMCALFALKAVKDLKIPLKKNCRLIFGTDEECGSSDIARYFSTVNPPKYTFTPDANFPVTNGEKGRFAKKFFADVDLINEKRTITSLSAGKTANAIPSCAEAVLKGIDEQKIKSAVALSENTGANFIVEGAKVICMGTGAHASLPENGNNPITALFEFLSHIDFDKKTNGFVSSLADLFPHGKWNGEAFGIDMEDKLGRLTMTLDIVHFDGEHFEGNFDARTPMCATVENCAEKVKSRLENYGFILENTDMIKPHYVDENSEFVKALLSAYEDYSGDKGECVTMGGGTYVHNIESGVAFGGIARDLQTNMHGADEFMPIKDLLTAAEIFTQVVINICS